MLNYIPAIDIKNNVIVTGIKGNRSLYKSISKKYKLNHDLIKFLERIYKSPLDIEFAISKSNKIHLLQVRPLIIKQKVKQKS